MVDTNTSATERRFTMPRRDAAQARSMGGIAAAISPLSDSRDASPKRVSGEAHFDVRDTPLTLRSVADIDTLRGPPNAIALAEACETRVSTLR